ncbi:MAG: transcription elongation factor GreA [Dehalococcoidia bacterium]|nr:transcription elongation factor GreA [Dehalococcoidia bacterium]
MADVTLSEAAARFAESLRGPSRQAAMLEVTRFVAWYGRDRRLLELRGHDISLYADVLGPATPDVIQRADQVRSFLAYLKKQALTDSNFAPHLRVRKSPKSAAGAASAPQPSMVELTREGIDALTAERETLLEQRLLVREDIRTAMLDKDFRENSPLDAAKNKQGHLEARLREIEEMLKRAVVVEAGQRSGRVRVGSAVHVRNLGSDRVVRYSIVGPTEANAADGKISSVSPVGKALLDRTVGDEVEVSVPAGVMRLKVEQIED